MRALWCQARAALLPLAFLSAACEDGAPLAADARSFPDAVRGEAAFVASCAPCHASGDGLDLAFFRFSDTTIIRRAVKHVDSATARDIVAHVRRLPVRPASRDLRLFQPGGTVLGGDVEFARHLFGSDRWPAGLASAELRAIDPLVVPVAVPLPLWSVEERNVDWMPESALPDAVLDDQGALARGALAGYRAAPTLQNLVRAVAALRAAERRMENPGAPCLLEVPERVDYARCFEVRRWIATLVAQHMIRYGLSGRLHPVLHDAWWDVGNVVRKAVQPGRTPLENGNLNWAAWMYLGWIFDPGRHASVYTGTGLVRLGLPRHATFVALRSEVERPARSAAPYADVKSAASFAPTHWVADAVRFGLAHLLERVRAGDVPPPGMARDEARAHLDATLRTVERRVADPARRAELLELGRAILAELPQQ